MSTTDDNNDQRGGDSEEITSSKKECISFEQNNVDAVTEDINSMAVVDTSTCANCGKESSSNNMNTCNKCKEVKYCNAACKKKHRKKHKKKCERRAAELHDEQLFKEVEPEECPICMLPMPFEADQTSFKSCCGRRICNGCIYAMLISSGKDICAFCRTPPPSSNEEEIKRTKTLIDKRNAEAFLSLAGYYDQGRRGLPRDHQKANELNLKAGELGCADGYYNLGFIYDQGRGVEVDEKKAKHFYELAAMNGLLKVRYSLGALEWRGGNIDRAYRHLIIAARAGHKLSLDTVKVGFRNGDVTKDEYANTLRAYQKQQDEMKSDERDKAEHLKRTGESDNNMLQYVVR